MVHSAWWLWCRLAGHVTDQTTRRANDDGTAFHQRCRRCGSWFWTWTIR